MNTSTDPVSQNRISLEPTHDLAATAKEKYKTNKQNPHLKYASTSKAGRFSASETIKVT